MTSSLGAPIARCGYNSRVRLIIQPVLGQSTRLLFLDRVLCKLSPPIGYHKGVQSQIDSLFTLFVARLEVDLGGIDAGSTPTKRGMRWSLRARFLAGHIREESIVAPAHTQRTLYG